MRVTNLSEEDSELSELEEDEDEELIMLSTSVDSGSRRSEQIFKQSEWMTDEFYYKENFRPKTNMFTANRILLSHTHMICMLATLTAKINIADSWESATLAEVKKSL